MCLIFYLKINNLRSCYGSDNLCWIIEQESKSACAKLLQQPLLCSAPQNKMQNNVHFRLHAIFFLLPWKVPAEISRWSMFFKYLREYLPYQTYVHTTFYLGSRWTWNWMFNGSIFYVWYLPAPTSARHCRGRDRNNRFHYVTGIEFASIYYAPLHISHTFLKNTTAFVLYCVVLSCCLSCILCNRFGGSTTSTGIYLMLSLHHHCVFFTSLMYFCFEFWWK